MKPAAVGPKRQLNDRWVAGLACLFLVLASQGATLAVLLRLFPLPTRTQLAAAQKVNAPKKVTVAPQLKPAGPAEPVSPTVGDELQKAVGACLVVGLPGKKLDKQTQSAIRNGDVSGVILMRLNLDSDGQIRQLTDDVRAAAADGGQPSPLICIDQEGGPVQRLRMGMPGAEEMARTPEKIREYGSVVGRKLADLGINVNFAPVLDLTTPGSSVLAGRTFSSEPKLAAQMGGDFADGLHTAGILAVGKHFPGHGLVTKDTHKEIAVTDAPKSELNRHLRAFKLAAPTLDGIMLSHIRYNGWDKEYPASLSPVLSQLATELVPNGLTFTDAADMEALQRYGTDSERAALALSNGTNVFLTVKPLSALGKNFTARVAEQIKTRKYDVARLKSSAVAVLRVRNSFGVAIDRPVP